MGLASFNRMRLRQDENMKASNVLKAKQEHTKLEEYVKEAKEQEAKKQEAKSIEKETLTEGRKRLKEEK